MRPTALVAAAVDALADADRLPAYVYDLDHLDEHLARTRSALAGVPGLEVLHAVKANPDEGLLAVIARHVDGLEVASGGELAHVRARHPAVPVAFGGPGKTDVELAAALEAGVERYHVESPAELRRLDRAARAVGRTARVLLRVNPPNAPSPVARPGGLTMGGVASPFGMDPQAADEAMAALAALSHVEVLGLHAHLGSGLDADEATALAEAVLAWSAEFARRHGLRLREVDVGGGMDVDYRRPDTRFDWSRYATGLTRAIERTGTTATVRIEPGRALSAYSGWYATRVLDLKRSHGEWFAVCAGGTHHLRTPAAKGHDQPLTVRPRAAPGTGDAEVTFVGQLCTPKDVLARRVPVARIAMGDLVVFGLAGAYAHNISHVDFLLHPPPAVIHVGERLRR